MRLLVLFLMIATSSCLTDMRSRELDHYPPYTSENEGKTKNQPIEENDEKVPKPVLPKVEVPKTNIDKPKEVSRKPITQPQLIVTFRDSTIELKARKSLESYTLINAKKIKYLEVDGVKNLQLTLHNGEKITLPRVRGRKKSVRAILNINQREVLEFIDIKIAKDPFDIVLSKHLSAFSN